MAKDEIMKVVVIGGSAGSLDVIMQMVPLLPADAGACYILVVHRKNDSESVLANIVSTKTSMRVREVEDKEPIVANSIFIAAPDYHLLVENREMFSLDSSEKLHYSRPSIDVTFESVAEMFGKRTIGVLLSGANADGANGLKRIKEVGGTTIVQDPDTSEVGFMPQQAIKIKAVDKILNADEIAPVLIGILKQNRI